MIQIGTKIREYRKEKKITQEQLAKFMNVSKTSVSKWENGQSYPDIVSLPKLAGFFNVTIDELLNYEAQLTKEEIREYYRHFAERFLTDEYEKVWQDCINLVEEYYRCFPLVLQMSILLLNHLDFNPDKSQIPSQINKIRSMLIHIKQNSEQPDLMQQALELEGMCALLAGKSDEVFQLLGTTSQPYIPKEPLIAGAYQMIGEGEKAKELYQAILYQQIVATVSLSSSYMMLGHDTDILYETIRRTERLIESYQMEELHPAIALQFYYSVVVRLFMAQEKEEAYRYLQKVLDFMIHNHSPYTLHGDDYFYLINQWIETELELGSQTPRSPQMALGSVLQGLETNPMLNEVRKEDRFQKLLSKFKNYMEEWKK